MLNPPEECYQKEARDEQNNTVISYSVLRNFISTQLKNMSASHKFMCGCDSYISSKSMHLYLLTQIDFYLKNLKTKVTTRTTEGLIKLQVEFLKPTGILQFHMVVTYKKRKHTWPYKECVHLHIINMRCHTLNVR